jgi:hypothetical protein
MARRDPRLTLWFLLCVAWIAAATAQAAGTDTVDASPSIFVLAAEVTPSPTAGAASVNIGVGSGTPDATGKVNIPVTLATGGAAVAGTQNDILFDNSVLQLDAADCSLNPALSDHPPDADPCTPSHVVAPCKQLVRSVVPCGADPQPFGCPDDAGSHVSVFHGLVFASMSALNLNSIPDGVVYTCTFTVLSPSQLPATLANRRAMASDAFGENLSATAVDGQVFPIPPTATSTPTQTPTVTRTPTPTPTFTPSPSATATRSLTPVPTDTAIPPTATSTPTQTPTVTHTPTRTPTFTPSPSATATPSLTPLPTGTAIPTSTATATLTAAPSSTPTVAPTTTPSSTPSSNSTPSTTPTMTWAFTPTTTATATPTPTPLSGAPGDGNCDGVISAADLPAVIEALGSSILTCTGLDADQDGNVTAADLSLAVQEIFADS